MQIVFFKREKPKSFTYRPRYYDAEQEEQELRRKELAGTMSDDEQRLRREFNRRWRLKTRKTEKRQSKMGLIFVLLALIALGYFFFFAKIF